MNQVSDVVQRDVKVEGYLIPWNIGDDQPAMIEIEGVVFLPVFSTHEKMQAAMGIARWAFPTKIKQITDTAEFLKSCLPHVRVALDPWVTERGTTRFTELKLA